MDNKKYGQLGKETLKSLNENDLENINGGVISETTKDGIKLLAKLPFIIIAAAFLSTVPTITEAYKIVKEQKAKEDQKKQETNKIINNSIDTTTSTQ